MPDIHSWEEPGSLPKDRRETLAKALRRSGEGDRRAFEEVYRLTSARLFGICLYILNSREEAEDALQDIYSAVWAHAGSYREDRGTAMTWLITLTRNRAVDCLRRVSKDSQRPIGDADHLTDSRPSAGEILESEEAERRLADCIKELEARDETLIRAAFFQGSTYPELAMRASTPLATVKSRIRRALLKLRACLQ